MSRRKTQAYSKVEYSKLNTNDADLYADAQFRMGGASQVPWKAIGLASLLFFGGLIMLVTGSLIFTGHIDTTYGDRMWPMIILGSIMFIPGAYHVRVAYYAFREVPGYSFEDIPEFE